MQSIGYVVLVLYLRPMSTWWVVWSVACWPRWLPRTFYGTHFKLGRPGSPGQWNLTGSRQIKKRACMPVTGLWLFSCAVQHTAVTAQHLTVGDSTVLDCLSQHLSVCDNTARDWLCQHSAWLSVTAQRLTVCDRTALDCLWHHSAWLFVTAHPLFRCPVLTAVLLMHPMSEVASCAGKACLHRLDGCRCALLVSKYWWLWIVECQNTQHSCDVDICLSVQCLD